MPVLVVSKIKCSLVVASSTATRSVCSGDYQDRLGLLLPYLDRPVADVLASHADQITAPLTGVEGEG